MRSATGTLLGSETVDIAEAEAELVLVWAAAKPKKAETATRERVVKRIVAGGVGDRSGVEGICSSGGI